MSSPVKVQDGKTLQRVVPSGKVYRQMFDAQVHLVRHLDQSRAQGPYRCRQQMCAGRPVANPAITEPSCGMLTTRQMTWVEEFPNESATENPILYKFFADELKENASQHIAKCLPRIEVQSLPDVIEPAKTGSDIMERITTSRQLRHDTAVDDMHQQLGLISTELEPCIESCCQNLMNQLDANMKEVSELLAAIDTDQKLVSYTMSELEELWKNVSQCAQLRQNWINSLDNVLCELENERVDRMRGIFERAWLTLEKVAYMMPADLQRMLDKECQLINQMVLNNKRMYADLKRKLLLSEIDQERKLFLYWRKRVDMWKQLQKHQAIDDFRVFMQSDAVINSSDIQCILTQATDNQNKLNQHRIQVIQSLQHIAPPVLCAKFVTVWFQQILNISKNIDEINQKYFNELCLQYEAICQMCLGEINTLKKVLVNKRVCTENEVDEFANGHCLPIVGELQAKFEKMLEDFDKDIETSAALSLSRLSDLCTFCQATAQVWDVHEIKLAQREKELNEKLDKLRLQHDTSNQDTEMKLDQLMDQMRQESTETALDDDLKKVFYMLDAVLQSYGDFFDQQCAVVAEYPDVIQQEVTEYSNTACAHFTVQLTEPDVNQSQPLASQLSQSEPQALSPAGEQASQSEPQPQSPPSQSEPQPPSPPSQSEPQPHSPSQSEPQPQSPSQSELQPQSPPSQSGLEKPNMSTQEEKPGPEIVQTDNGAVYIVTVSQEQADSTKVLDGEMSAGNQDVPVIEEVSSDNEHVIQSIIVESSVIEDVQKAMRLTFLNHLEFWKEEAVHRARLLVDVKVGELRSELDLRKHLHEPRSRRAELDVHNVRAAELLMHSERVSRHVNGVEQVLTELKEALESLNDDQSQRITCFEGDIQRLETVVSQTNKSYGLTDLSNRATKMQADVVEDIHLGVEQFREHMLHAIKTLRESTAQLVNSFKTFDLGGNFCASEVLEYSKRIEKITQKIDAVEQTLLSELTTMEPKRNEQSLKILHEFEDKFKTDMIDLVFVEKVAKCLTNCQVKIKTEVGESNSQSQHITKALGQFECLIIACEQPGPDNGYGKSCDLLAHLSALFELMSNRCIYLNCHRPDVTGPSTQSPHVTSVDVTAGQQADLSCLLQPNEVAMSHISDVIPPISKPGGKSPTEDVSVITIRHILKTQKFHQQDGDMLSSSASVDSLAKIASLQNQANGKKPVKETKSTAQKEKPHRAAEQKQTTSGKGGSKNKIDPRNFIFGEAYDEHQQQHFLGRIKAIAQTTQNAIFATAELFYKQKGQRPVTRPGLLQETLEQCADTVTRKLETYTSQAETYHNNCIQEFRLHLATLESIAQRVPCCVMKEILQKILCESSTEQAQLDMEFNVKFCQLNACKEANNNSLRPALGHPAQLDSLKTLCDNEQQRHNMAIDVIATHTILQQNAIFGRCCEFIDTLSHSSEQLLLLFDSMLVPDDVIVGKVNAMKSTPAQLIRQSMAGITQYEPIQSADCLIRGPTTWPGLDIEDLQLNCLQVTEPLVTASCNHFSIEPSCNASRHDSNTGVDLSNNSTHATPPAGDKSSHATPPTGDNSTHATPPTGDNSTHATPPAGDKSTHATPPTGDNGTHVTAPAGDKTSHETLPAGGNSSHATTVAGDKSSHAIPITGISPVTTAKATVGHLATIAARDEAYQHFKSHVESTVENIEALSHHHTTEEMRWNHRWQTSVEKIKQLY